MKKIGLGLLLIIALVAAAGPVQAFDGNRKGFLLNLGAGYGKYSTTNNFSENGFVSDFKIGGGINPQIVIYYTNRILFYQAGTDSETRISGMTGVGVSYFITPRTQTFFFSGALGVGSQRNLEDDFASKTGTGFTLGAGFEFAPNWTIEASLMKATVGDYDQSITNLMLTLSWFAY